MHTTSFLIGLIIGAGIISIIYWFINSNKKNTSNDDIKFASNGRIDALITDVAKENDAILYIVYYILY